MLIKFQTESNLQNKTVPALETVIIYSVNEKILVALIIKTESEQY